MNVAFITAEAVPFAKTGGLADVCGALPREIARQGHDVCLFLPAYRSALQGGQPIEPAGVEFHVPIATRDVKGRLLRSRLPRSEVTVYLVDQPAYFDRPALYGERGKDYLDNCERFVFFCRAALEAMKRLGPAPDLLHAHDWQTGLVPAYLKTLDAAESYYADTASLFSLHNLAYQGRFWHWDMLLTGIDWKHFNWQEMEFHGDLNLLKTGIVFADWLTTVSPTYAREIQSEPLGCGLEGVLAERSNRLTGIINGIDTDLWNPSTDPHLVANYSVDNFETGKRACKEALLRELDLPVDPDRPLIGIIGRLAHQKGWDIVLPLIQKNLKRDVMWAVLGSGDPNLENELLQFRSTSPHHIAVHIGFDEPLAHRIEAAADMFLMASRYEPCGLNQLYSQRYGTLPIVHATGGLKDTVVDATEEAVEAGRATGYHFSPFTLEALETTVDRALTRWRHDRASWHRMVKHAMSQDWSWERSAREYVRLYRSLIERHRRDLVHSPPASSCPRKNEDRATTPRTNRHSWNASPSATTP